MVKFYSDINKNEIMKFAGKWSYKITLFSDVIQAQKDNSICMLYRMQILYCNVHILTQKSIGVDKDKTTTEETKSTKGYGGW